MMNAEVCLSPELIHHYDLKGKVVVVTDILRATSSMVAGLGSGVQRIVPVETQEEVPYYRAQGYLAAGERDGKTLEGFDLGNSPFEHMQCGGQKIVMTTTNGTVALSCSTEADRVIVGAFLNLSAVADCLREWQQDMVIVCAGWKGRLSMEDTLFAGALLHVLHGQVNLLDDEGVSALTLYRSAMDDFPAYMAQASHVRRINGLGAEEDFAYCLRIDEFDVVPVLQEGGLVPLQ